MHNTHYPGSSLLHRAIELLERVRHGSPGKVALALGAAALVYAVAKTGSRVRAEERAEADLAIDPVDQASWESFPASDPPAYTTGGI